MITTAEEFLDMVTVNKDRSLGKWTGAETMAYIDSTIQSVAKMPLNKETLEDIKRAITEKIDSSLLDHTNVEMHFVIQSDSMTQYISPYLKKYDIGNTKNGVEERILWMFRPDKITPGYVKEVTEQVGPNRLLSETNTHVFGTCEEFCNMVILHTHEYDINKNTDFSTIHFAVYVPALGNMMNEIVKLYRARAKAREEFLKGMNDSEEKPSHKKSVRHSKSKLFHR